MALLDDETWRGRVYSCGWVTASGGGTANLDAFTETRWVTIRGDIAPYPF
jgi:benzaldehyde dehydrogenase (NAD)